MRKYILAAVAFLFVGSVWAQTTYRIDIDQPSTELLRGHLDLGGKNPAGEEISVNSYFIEKDGKPFIPIIGEFHFSRFPEAYWEESILKMKAGGINVIASYVFWNIHERQEGQFDWSGDLNLRKFIELVAKHNMYAIVRMGPFCHGEMRNGGIPDWLYGRSFEIRSNDAGYLAYVDTLYGQIAQQIQGLLFRNGGPIIGVQLENEYQHSAAPWEFSFPGGPLELTVAHTDASLAHVQIAHTDGTNPQFEYGKLHMANLKAIAQKHGIDVPLYTATGWGNATIVERGSLPVTAGYAYPFWAEPAPSDFYLFKDIRKNPDYSPVSYDTRLYPSISCEIGPGIQPKYTRRPIVPFESVKPLMVRIVGSGSNGIGYYMYHGGSTPQFNGRFFNEEANGLPRVNYDFQAPIGQYGQVRPHYNELRMLHLFLESYGEQLAPMTTVLPSTNAAIAPQNTETLRYAVRALKNSGFLFLVNFQDHVQVKDLTQLRIQVEAGGETIAFPAQGTIDVPCATGAILPFNLQLETTNVKSATVQPFNILRGEAQNRYVFTTVRGVAPEMNFAGSARLSKLKNARVRTVNGLKNVRPESDAPFSFVADGVHFLVLTEDMALNSVKIDEKLIVSDALILNDSGKLQLISRKAENRVHVFPAGEKPLLATGANLVNEKAQYDGFDTYRVTFEEQKLEVEVAEIRTGKYTLQLKGDLSTLNDVFVEVDYVGDRALAFIGGELITDHLYQERTWELSLKPFEQRLKSQPMVLLIHPMESTAPYLKDLSRVPAFESGKYLKVNGFKVVPEYKATLTIR